MNIHWRGVTLIEDPNREGREGIYWRESNDGAEWSVHRVGDRYSATLSGPIHGDWDALCSAEGATPEEALGAALLQAAGSMLPDMVSARLVALERAAREAAEALSAHPVEGVRAAIRRATKGQE